MLEATAVPAVVQWDEVTPCKVPPAGLNQLTVSWVTEGNPPRWTLRFYRWPPAENGRESGPWEPEMSAAPIPEQGFAVGEVHFPGKRHALRLATIQVGTAP